MAKVKDTKPGKKNAADEKMPARTTAKTSAPAPAEPSNFIRDIITEDIKANRNGGGVATRFPPEPNGYLHIGHAKAICINFGLAAEFGGTTNLRFDDTNPTTEDVEYVDAIQNDIRWLGFKWKGLYYASDYFESLYETAVKLIKKGKAYVDSLNEEQIREHRGDYFKKGVESPFRNRSIEENLDLLTRMRNGEFKEGEHVLRAKIDVSAQNMNMRDPILYRIRYAAHHRTGKKWCIYPMYDYAHPLSDAIEKITYSLCSLEFEDHRPLYDWCIREGEVFPSRQIEFARLNLTYTVMSKRKFLELVGKGIVSGWDDPRMPTLAGLRRRGYTPEAIRDFCERIGVAKADSIVDVGLLEHCLREDLNKKCPRLMAVLRPLRLVIDNYPEGEKREFEAPFFPDEPQKGTRKVPFGKVLYIERDDFREDPPKDWFRLAPGREVRMRYACLVRCTEVRKDKNGEVVELHCTWDPASLGGTSPDGRVVKGTIHWVSAAHAIGAEARLYDRLFTVENPGAQEGKSFLEEINPDSLVTLNNCKLEPASEKAKPGEQYQFERLGYFIVDADSRPDKVVFNRTVTLKDTWAKIEARGGAVAHGAAAVEARSHTNAARGGAVAAATLTAKKVDNATPAEITMDDFNRLDLRVGVVKTSETVAGADKLIRLQVDIGEGRLRQIFAGLKQSYPDPAALIGKRVIVVANLKPRQMKFGLSEGMVLAGGGGEHPYKIATFDETGPEPGDRTT
jgi:glutaminyl-tRNA synthetase